MSKPRKIDLVLRGKNIDGKTMFLTPHLQKDWATHFDNENWVCTFKLVSSMNEKQRMFGYMFGPLLDSALAAFESAGVEFANKDDIYYHFKTLFAREPWYNPVTKKEQQRLIDFSKDDVPVDLLNKFINDIILYLEQNFDFTAPDAEAYRTQKTIGKGFASVKGKKFTDV